MQILHRLLAGGARAIALPLPLGDLQVFHQLVQLVHQLGGLGHPAFFHQLLNAIHQGLNLVRRDLHIVLLGGLRGVGLVRIGLHVVGQHLDIIIRRLAQFLHQGGNFSIRRAIAHRLGQTFLGAAQTFAGIGQRAIL